jgi:Domain of unknown function (DUF4349)
MFIPEGDPMRCELPRAGALVLLLAASLVLPACDRLGEARPEPLSEAAPGVAARGDAKLLQARDALRPFSAPAPAAPAAAQALAAPADRAVDASVRQRYLAIRHDLAVLTAADTVESAWKAAEAACVQGGCELLASSIAHDDDRFPATASLDARIPPDSLPAFLERLGGLGTIGRHSTTAEDRTAEVVDVEARQKNMAEFRDNLRKLMATPNARLKDLIDVERELTRVQSELDSLASRRKVLANDTDKVRVGVAFSARPAVLEAGLWFPVKSAALRAGHVFAGSVAALIGVAVACLPWLLVALAGGVGLRSLWRRRRRQRAAASAVA